MAVDVDCRRRIVVRGAIGDGGIAVERRTNQALVDPLPRRSVGAAIDVGADDVARRRNLPVQIHDMVGCCLNDDVVRHLRDMASTARDLYGKGVSCCGGGRSGEVQ